MFSELFDMFNEVCDIFNKSFGIFNDFSVLFCGLYFCELYILHW